MKIIYQLARGRVAKTDMVVELSLREIAGMLIGRELRLETPHDSVVLRNAASYSLFTTIAPRAHGKA